MFPRAILFAVACTMTATSMLCGGSVALPRTIPLNKLDHVVVIDGDLAKWGNLLVGGAAVVEQLNVLAGLPGSDNTDAAVFKVAHDDQAIYIAIQVVDSSICTAEPLWAGDCVEVFLDVRPSGEGENKFSWHAYSPGVYHLGFAPPSADNPKARWINGSTSGPVGEIQAVGKLLADGYSLEIRIPLASINTTANRLKDPIGLDVAIDNVDLVAGHKTDIVQYNFGGSEEDWADPSGFPHAVAGAPGIAEGGAIIQIRPAQLLPPGRGGWNSQPKRMLRGGVLMKGDAVKAADAPISVSLRYLGNELTQTRADTTAIRLQSQVATQSYPQLGLVCSTLTASLDSTKTGHYEVITSLGDAQALKTHFQAATWSATTQPIRDRTTRADGQSVNSTANAQYQLFNGWKLSPAGTATPLTGDMPVKMIWSSDGRQLLVQTAGFHDQGISVFDLATGKVTATLPTNKTWPGLCISPDGKVLLVSGSSTGTLLTYALPAFSASPPIKLPGTKDKKTWVAGLLALTAEDGAQSCYAVDEGHDCVFCFPLGDGKSAQISPNTLKTGYAPYAIAGSPDGRFIAVSNWGDQSISIFDRASGKGIRVPVGSHPNELVWSKDGRIYVACSGSNSVSVVRDGKVTETIKTCLDPAAPVGSTPIALAISSDQQRLYVANADNNDVAVIDISQAGQSRILGLIPTGWYPSALAVSRDSKTLYVGVGKGMAFAANPTGEYIGDVLNGAVEVIAVPDQAQLGLYTRQVIANTPASERQMKISDSQQATLKNVFPRIKHVLWIIRENRTYDQILGDLPYGNGDPSLAIFGKDVTPNAHALAQEFTLLDNLYCSGEVSEDGHEWCNAAYATDFTEKAWINSYSDRGEPDSDDRLTKSPAGYLWDNCRRNNVTYRSYGEYAVFSSDKNHAPVFHGDKSLEGHASLAWSVLDGKRDYERVEAFIGELRDAEKSGDWPAYMVMSLGEDHTMGGSANSFTPDACVASNDQALGKIVEAVSRSKFWASTAIFVMEDDAQDGPDHVDAHRTVGFVISPYTRRHAVDSTLYTTVSFVHSMELMLKLEPMTQYDSSAMPVFNAMTEQADFSPFALEPARIDMAEKNKTTGPDAEASAKLDLSGYDRCDPTALNLILWHMCKPGELLPAPVRSIHWSQ
jgi:YVTN family beta-propeller protein